MSWAFFVTARTVHTISLAMHINQNGRTSWYSILLI